MKWSTLLIIAAIIVVIFAFKQIGQISTKEAVAYLKNGALLIDVRSPGEFNSGHLPAAINFPLDDITTSLPPRVTQLNQVLLLHCQSGMRSGLAKKKLEGLGYTQVYNLGSFTRAKEIVDAAAGD